MECRGANCKQLLLQTQEICTKPIVDAAKSDLGTIYACIYLQFQQEIASCYCNGESATGFLNRMFIDESYEKMKAFLYGVRGFE